MREDIDRMRQDLLMEAARAGYLTEMRGMFALMDLDRTIRGHLDDLSKKIDQYSTVNSPLPDLPKRP